MKGFVEIRAWRRGRLLWTRERDNLVVNAGLVCAANLLGGNVAGQSISAIGFGSGAATPAVTDTALGSPSYYRALGTVSYPAAGQVQFAWSLSGSTDWGALGINIQEMALYCNTAPVTLPAAVATANPNWAASHAYVVGNLIVDSNGNVQECTTAGTSGASAPTWATTIGNTTSDGSAVWTLRAFHTAPSPMFAHVLNGIGLFNSTMNFTGSWTITA